ncbi:assembly protein [Salmonella enterica subsp. enterica]|nr:assembly protein [Salmonella enterica subsp. enterica]
MAVYFVTGKLGSGKTLVSVGKIQDKIVSGCKIATNLDLRLHNLPQVGRFAKTPRVLRIPDKPSISDLLAIGRGNESYDENKNGLLVLDECGTWFNTRSWNDKERQPIIDWFLHARKLGWDIIFLVQDLSIVDKQARSALAEHVVYCRRLDRITLPFVGTLYSLITGSKMPLPKLHVGVVKYGDSQLSPTVERWLYTGKNLYNAYDTKQAFSSNYDSGVYTYLTPYLTHGRYFKPLNLGQKMKLTRIYLKKFSRILCLALGFASAFTYTYITQPKQEVKKVVSQTYDFDKFTIDSSQRLNLSYRYVFKDSKGKLITSDDLKKQGYSLTYIDLCTVSIKKGNSNEIVKCN